MAFRIVQLLQSFNPHARVGRDNWSNVAKSILQYVSIHTPAWGATMEELTSIAVIMAFQSTRPRGARLVPSSPSFATSDVSIHTPAWGATLFGFPATSLHLCFNPHARVGRDVSFTHSALVIIKFQSTRPRGARLYFQPLDLAFVQFQSTRPRGARRIYRCRLIYISTVSIHTPAWGATRYNRWYD